MHRHPIERHVERGQEADDFEVELLAKDVQSPCAILAGTPGEKDFGAGHGLVIGSETDCQDSRLGVPSPAVELIVDCTNGGSPNPPSA